MNSYATVGGGGSNTATGAYVVFMWLNVCVAAAGAFALQANDSPMTYIRECTKSIGQMFGLR